jgi:hypothetical protein
MKDSDLKDERGQPLRPEDVAKARERLIARAGEAKLAIAVRKAMRFRCPTTPC